MAETKISTLTAHTVNPIQGEILPPPTPDALGAHRQALLQTLRDFQAGAIEEAEVKRRTVASREFIGRAKAWIEADGAQYVALRELRRTLKAVEQLAAPTSSTTTTARKKLTEAAVARIKPPATGRMQIPDGHLSGLWLRITDRDVRSWSVLYRVNGGPVRRLTLGKWPAVGVADARELAREALRMAAKGQDPAAVKRAERDEPSDRFDLVAAEFVTRHCKIYQRRWTETEQLIAKYLLPPWRARRLGQIAKPDVLRVVDAISDAGHHRQANKVLALIRQIFKWAIGRGLVERDPAAGIDRPHPERSRDRVLEDHELVAVWNAAGEMGWPWFPYVRLLILTAARRSEVANMRWQDVDLDAAVWRMPAEATKMGRARELPLPGAAVELIRALPRIAGAAFVFPSARAGSDLAMSGFSKAKRRLDQLSGVTGWRIHDLRRSVATGLQRLGIRLEVTEAALGHIGGSRGGIVGVYQRHAYSAEQRAALEQWADHLMRLLGGQGAKVVRLRG